MASHTNIIKTALVHDLYGEFYSATIVFIETLTRILTEFYHEILKKRFS